MRRGVKGEIDRVDDDGLALWAAGIKQTSITDFFHPTASVGLEENGKESSGTPGGGLVSGPPRPEKITAFYPHIEKRQGVGEKAKTDWTWVDAGAGEHRV